jgi:hypothetical protein
MKWFFFIVVLVSIEILSSFLRSSIWNFILSRREVIYKLVEQDMEY